MCCQDWNDSYSSAIVSLTKLDRIYPGLSFQRLYATHAIKIRSLLYISLDNFNTRPFYFSCCMWDGIQSEIFPQNPAWTPSSWAVYILNLDHPKIQIQGMRMLTHPQNVSVGVAGFLVVIHQIMCPRYLLPILYNS